MAGIDPPDRQLGVSGQVTLSMDETYFLEKKSRDLFPPCHPTGDKQCSALPVSVLHTARMVRLEDVSLSSHPLGGTA